MWIVRRGGKKSRRGFCPSCAAEAEMLSSDDAVDFSRLPLRELIRQTESGAVHAIETANGHLLICRKSLQNFLHTESRVEPDSGARLPRS